MKIISICIGCSESDDTIVNPKNTSFFPMSIGSYWKNDDEILPKLQIQ